MSRGFERPSQSPIQGRSEPVRQSPSRQASSHGIGMTSMRTRNRLIERLRDAGIRDEMVLMAMAKTPRHLFVDGSMANRAYDDDSLPIGFGQTISQPWVVARMTESLKAGLDADTKFKSVLEIGTGCGYQTAVLSRLADRVYSVERILGLQRQAIQRFRDQKLHNIQCKHVDGQMGWPIFQPFDAIIVTAAAGEIPPALIDQLSVGGRLVIPVGVGEDQELMLLIKTTGGVEKMILDRVCFVPLLPGESE